MDVSAASAATKPTFIITLLIIFFSLSSVCTSSIINPQYPSGETPEAPTPTPWPHQFHSILVMNNSGVHEVIDLWYDWVNGRNFNIIQKQLGELLYDLEWNNGTSFYYTLDSNKKCRTVHFQVGILRPNWLDGANYLGQQKVDGFVCNVWEKVDFITYYEDVVTKRPVHWVFYTGRNAHVMTFEVGAVLEDEKWQAPVYCFDKNSTSTSEEEVNKPQLVQVESVVGGDDGCFHGRRRMLERLISSPLI